MKKKLIANPYLDSEILLSKTLKITREKLLLNLDKKIKIDDTKIINIKIDKFQIHEAVVLEY